MVCLYLDRLDNIYSIIVFNLGYYNLRGTLINRS